MRVSQQTNFRADGMLVNTHGNKIWPDLNADRVILLHHYRKFHRGVIHKVYILTCFNITFDQQLSVAELDFYDDL